MKKEKIRLQSLNEMAEEWGVDYEVLKIKLKLIKRIKKHCENEKISQRALAKMIPGLTQDRVSKIFNDQIGHMTIDKLVQILSVLNIRVDIKLMEAA